jgi:hypothetical protein
MHPSALHRPESCNECHDATTHARRRRTHDHIQYDTLHCQKLPPWNAIRPDRPTCLSAELTKSDSLVRRRGPAIHSVVCGGIPKNWSPDVDRLARLLVIEWPSVESPRRARLWDEGFHAEARRRGIPAPRLETGVHFAWPMVLGSRAKLYSASPREIRTRSRRSGLRLVRRGGPRMAPIGRPDRGS